MQQTDFSAFGKHAAVDQTTLSPQNIGTFNIIFQYTNDPYISGQIRSIRAPVPAILPVQSLGTDGINQCGNSVRRE